jgi:hypothetical protein
MEKRYVISDLNPDWVIGFVEQRDSKDADWQRSLHSEWVFARNGKNVGEREPDDENPFPVPAPRETALYVCEPGETINALFRAEPSITRMFDRIAVEAWDRVVRPYLDDTDA